MGSRLKGQRGINKKIMFVMCVTQWGVPEVKCTRHYGMILKKIPSEFSHGAPYTDGNKTITEVPKPKSDGSHRSLSPLLKTYFVMVIQFEPNLVQKHDSFTH